MPHCIPATTSLSEGQRTDAKEAAVLYCGTSTPSTTGIAFLPKFTTASAYMAYKRACNAQNAVAFRASPVVRSGTLQNVTAGAVIASTLTIPPAAYGYVVSISWTAVSGIGSYQVTPSGTGLGSFTVVITGDTSANVFFNWTTNANTTLTLTVTGVLASICTYTGSTTATVL